MVEQKYFNYLYLGKLGKLANPINIKRISENLEWMRFMRDQV